MRNWHRARGRVCVPACVFLMFASTGLAQDDSEAVTTEQLRDELARRDAIIIDLLNRIEALEAERDSAASEGGARPADTGALAADPGAASDNTPANDFDVEELLAERALERGLVERGARLLPPGRIEFSPQLSLYRDEGMFPTALMDGDVTTVGEVERTLELHERRADVRFGLPLNMQLEIGLPYLLADQRLATVVDGSIQAATDQSGSGDGDATLGLAKAFGSDASGGAAVIGRITWLTGSGDERDGAVFLGGGTAGINAQATAYWRRDPVVFLASGGYTHFDEENALQRGDRFNVSLGLGLAVSPEAALIFSLDQTQTNEFRMGGVALPGTDQLSSSLGIAVQTLLGQRFSLGVDTDIGLTDDAADYRFGVSLSSRFSVR